MGRPNILFLHSITANVRVSPSPETAAILAFSFSDCECRWLVVAIAISSPTFQLMGCNRVIVVLPALAVWPRSVQVRPTGFPEKGYVCRIF